MNNDTNVKVTDAGQVVEESILEQKSFTFRNIPSKLHRQWKVVSSIAGMNMEEFGHKAIEFYIEHWLKSQKDELIKAVGVERKEKENKE